MTKDEAFKLAMQACKKTWNEKTCKQIKEVLEQQPCDAISRAEAQTEIRMSKSITAFDRDLWIRTKDAVHILRELPSVTQKSGRWIMSDDGLYRPICDKCGAHPWKGYIPTVEEATEVFKYCPNCGAKMQESEDKK